MDILKTPYHSVPDAEYIVDDEARRLFEEAYDEHMNGDLEEAVDLYSRSIKKSPSAPAYTFLAWALSSTGDYDHAIDLCKVAIDLDPDYGNPYNDIGVYKMALGDEDGAIEWLQKSLDKPKYESKCFPYYNLGKIYASKGMIKKGMLCYEMALSYEPDFDEVKELLDELKSQLN